MRLSLGCRGSWVSRLVQGQRVLPVLVSELAAQLGEATDTLLIERWQRASAFVEDGFDLLSSFLRVPLVEEREHVDMALVALLISLADNLHVVAGACRGLLRWELRL